MSEPWPTAGTPVTIDPAMSENYYQLLGVPPQASQDAIARAWKFAAMRNHPDRFAHLGDEAAREANAKMASINEAFQILSDPGRRRHYDLEHGLIAARCTECGKPGALRLADGGRTVAYCDACYARSLATS